MRRRKFLKDTSLAGSAILSTSYVPGLFQDQKLRVGLIGSGWYGMVIAEAGLEVGGIEVVGVADVDENHLAESVSKLASIQGSTPKAFKDYRELLEEPNLDAIFIGTQPHWHALQFIAACEKGLDIYCEKPLSYDVAEGRAMVAAAQRAGNFVQIGFQRRKAESLHKVKAMIQEGKIGKVHEVGAQIHFNPTIKDTTPQEPPSGLDWDAWCGPAPKLDYRPSIGHKSWRLERAYGNGHLFDWGIHHVDAVRMMFGLDMPNRFVTSGGMTKLAGQITTPDTLRATMFFDEFPLVWQHRMWGTGSLDKSLNNGIHIYGEDATVFVSDRHLRVLSNAKDAELEVHEVSAGTIRQDMMRDFILAVQKQDKGLISCPIEEGASSTACVQLSMISYYSNSDVDWDQATHTISNNNEEASKLLARPYREGYTRPS